MAEAARIAGVRRTTLTAWHRALPGSPAPVQGAGPDHGTAADRAMQDHIEGGLAAPEADVRVLQRGQAAHVLVLAAWSLTRKSGAEGRLARDGRAVFHASLPTTAWILIPP
ncbi:hypothetical protein [Streptomyces lavendulae]|uniref:hypothetical protein n=1 Tax=Streptomyces lavendulae TaxID=1914 RepID=UPI0025542F76|nr:hypothetical protein [Streptomyces lavendulae]